MRRVDVVRVLAAVVVTAGCAAGPAEPDAADAPPERLYPAPTSSVFTPAPFDAPVDPEGFWAVLEDLLPRLAPSSPGDIDAERRRLQACDHLRQLVEVVARTGSDRYDVGSSSGELMAIAATCPDNERSVFLALQAVVEQNPYRTGG